MAKKDKEALERAKKADLVALPKGLEGASCGSCRYFGSKNSGSWCFHREVQQPVADRNVCSNWDHPKAERSWEE